MFVTNLPNEHVTGTEFRELKQIEPAQGTRLHAIHETLDIARMLISMRVFAEDNEFSAVFAVLLSSHTH